MFSLRFVWDKLRGVRWKVIVALTVSFISMGLAVFTPYLSKFLVDRAIVGGETRLLVPLVCAMIGAIALKGLFHIFRILLYEQASQTMVVNIRMSLFGTLQHQDMDFYDRIRTGDIITRSTGDLEYLRHFVAYVIYVCLDTVIFVIASIIMLLTVSVPLTLAYLCTFPFMIWVSLAYSKKVKPLYRANREALSQLNTGATENIDGNRVVKAFAREAYEKEKFDRLSEEYRSANLKSAMANFKFAPVMSFFSQIITIIAMLAGGYLAIRGDISVGDITLFVSLGGVLGGSITSIPGLINSLNQFGISSAKVIELIESAPLIADRDDAVALPRGERLKGEIEFRDVSFAYRRDRDRKVLDDVSFHISPGETVAIMGPTGCGKTTVVDLLARFYDTTSGDILLDGVSIRHRRLIDIHRSIGIATQDVFLFSDTVDGNIAFSDPEMSEEAVHEYASLAAADGFIRRMEEGYDTVIGERGVGLSGGQRQRVALARALASRPSVLVLDDTTSALDMETERDIQHSLAALPFDCTKIIVAQRISSVRHADRIMILRDGKVDIGDHMSLARTNSYYREICELQDVAGLPAFEGGNEQ